MISYIRLEQGTQPKSRWITMNFRKYPFWYLEMKMRTVIIVLVNRVGHWYRDCQNKILARDFREIHSIPRHNIFLNWKIHTTCLKFKELCSLDEKFIHQWNFDLAGLTFFTDKFNKEEPSIMICFRRVVAMLSTDNNIDCMPRNSLKFKVVSLLLHSILHIQIQFDESAKSGPVVASDSNPKVGHSFTPKL